MAVSLLLDQPDLISPAQSRRLRFGSDAQITILNARGRRFVGGGDEPDLSLKWIPQGGAHYRSGGRTFALAGDTQLLLNRQQPYTLEMREPSESLVVFFSLQLADSAWLAHSGIAEPFPEVPAVAGHSPPSLQQSLVRLRSEVRAAKPDGARVNELALALLGDIAALAAHRCRMAARLPALRRSTRDELLRRLARAEAYLLETGHGATLEEAAAAAALSPFHFIRAFRAAYGEPPLAWAAGRRLERARDTLIVTADGIDDIAHATGYESRTAFDRAFVRRFGVTPGAVRVARH